MYDHTRKLSTVNYRFLAFLQLPNSTEFRKSDFRFVIVTFLGSRRTFSQLELRLSCWERVADLNRDSCVVRKKKNLLWQLTDWKAIIRLLHFVQSAALKNDRLFNSSSCWPIRSMINKQYEQNVQKQIFYSKEI